MKWAFMSDVKTNQINQLQGIHNMSPRLLTVDVEIEDKERNDEEDDDEEAGIEVSGEDSQLKKTMVHGRNLPHTQPTLKITLKLPPSNVLGSNNSPRTATPEELSLSREHQDGEQKVTKVIQDIDIESEDPSSPSVASDDAAQSARESGSRSTGIPSASVKPMTTRQAVLASVVDSSHTKVQEEETARKRKNLSEEDERAETINRLLKKQNRSKNKRMTALDDWSPLTSVSGSRTPKIKIKTNVQEEGEEADGDEEEDEVMDIVEEPPKEAKPVMYRWVSSLRIAPSTGSADRQMEMGITFSVPEAFVPPQVNQDLDYVR
ncbi:hypothetical protein BYT27DRAFT_7255610 [Phlegmacium glaucopus]|nr:hypothetical protein BYT27DRAFT_7255610 [Phlegmacium glaucopus]